MDSRKTHQWSNFASTYDPIKVGSIDGTDTLPHDKGIIRALQSKYSISKNVRGKPNHTLFVGRLNTCTTQETIERKFSSFGKIVMCRLVRDIVTGISKGYAFIEYDNENSLHKAYEYMNMEYIDNAKLIVDYEMERLLPGWKPRRSGGGFGGKKESGQLRFGCRSRPFRKPIVIKTK